MNLLEMIIVLSIVAFSASLTMPALSRMNKSAEEQVQITKVIKEVSEARLASNIKNKIIKSNGITFFPNLTNTKGEIKFDRRKITVSKYGILRVVRNVSE